MIIKKICHLEQARKGIKSWMFSFFPPLTSTYHSTSSSLLSFSTFRIHHSHLFPHNWIFINFQFINHVHIFQFSCRFYWLKDFIWFLMRLSMCRWWKVYSYFFRENFMGVFLLDFFISVCLCLCMNGEETESFVEIQDGNGKMLLWILILFWFLLWMWNGKIR